MVESRWVSSFLNSFLWDPRRAIHGVRWFIWNGVAFGLIVAKNRNKITRQILALYATSFSSGTERAQKHKHTCFLEAKQAINSELQPIGSAENETSMNLLHYPSCVRPPIFVISSSPSNVSRSDSSRNNISRVSVSSDELNAIPRWRNEIYKLQISIRNTNTLFLIYLMNDFSTLNTHKF